MSLILDLLFPRLCLGCGKSGDYLCPECQKNLPLRTILPSVGRLEGVLPVFRYHGPVRRLVHDLKFGYVSDNVSLITGLISGRLQSEFPHLLRYWQENDFTLVPVPLHSFRQNYRGFNQSALIAAALAPLLKLPINTDILHRFRFTPAQSGQTRTARLLNPAAAFSLEPSAALPGHIILFDDVYTTGSTLKSAASVFPMDTQIWGLTFAG